LELYLDFVQGIRCPLISSKEANEIQDFHYLDKMMIFTHNISATQELHRMLKRQETIIDTQQTVINSLISRIEMLEGV